jgi:rRNA small subunit pseudouridine methyltransferase Nep1
MATRAQTLASKTTRALGGKDISNRPASQVVVDKDLEQRRRPQPSAELGHHHPGASAPPMAVRPTRAPRGVASPNAKKVVVILAKAGLKVGYDGLIDAYDRGNTTKIALEHLTAFRPDIVHQCMLALFDSDMAAAGRLQVFILTHQDRTIEVSPALRPPRTYGRFKGLMEKLLNDGIVKAADGQWLLRTSRWSIAPQIPHGAEVYGIHNADSSVVVGPAELARGAVAEPVSDALQGGIKNAYGFYCISCTDDSNLDGLDFVTQTLCLSKYPTTPHVACMRIAEGFRLATSAVTNTGAPSDAAGTLTSALQTPALGVKRTRGV